jgi:hypothetical protein
MGNLHVIVRILFIAVVVAASGVSLFFWFRALRQIANSGLDPEERRKWRQRVLVYRGIGLIQWERHRRKLEASTSPRRPEDEGLNDAPPPGSS